MNNLDIILEQTQNDFPDIDKEWVEKIIHYGQWKATKEAMSEFKSIEITGLGRFNTRPTTIKTHIKTMERQNVFYEKQLAKATTEKEQNKWNTCITKNNVEITYIKTKL